MRRAVPLLAATLLVGCAAIRPAPAVPGAAIDPSRVIDWTARGRLGISVGEQGGSGSFTWQQRAATTDLTVRGPLGTGALHIVIDGESLAATDADGRSLDTAATRELMRARLGGDLPLAQLRYWMLGLAAPGSDAQVVQHDGPPARVIEQSGWRVTYEQFVAAAGWSVPARLTADSGSARIRVVLDDWILPPARTRASSGATP